MDHIETGTREPTCKGKCTSHTLSFLETMFHSPITLVLLGVNTLPPTKSQCCGFWKLWKAERALYILWDTVSWSWPLCSMTTCKSPIHKQHLEWLRAAPEGVAETDRIVLQMILKMWKVSDCATLVCGDVQPTCQRSHLWPFMTNSYGFVIGTFLEWS